MCHFRDLVGSDESEATVKARLIAACTQTLEGEPFVLDAKDAKALPIRIAAPISNAILRVSGFLGDEDDLGKSETTHAADSDSS